MEKHGRAKRGIRDDPRSLAICQVLPLAQGTLDFLEHRGEVVHGDPDVI